jgi:Flp pilus assembly pilin Flp
MPFIVANRACEKPQNAKLLAVKKPAPRKRLGQALSEYLILTSLVVVGSIAVVQVLGSNLQSRLAMVAAALGGKKKTFAGEQVRKEHYEIRDLGDFTQAMQDNSEDESK